eukprot:jgi/Hompol1/920/HPOL_001054-RA
MPQIVDDLGFPTDLYERDGRFVGDVANLLAFAPEVLRPFLPAGSFVSNGSAQQQQQQQQPALPSSRSELTASQELAHALHDASSSSLDPMLSGADAKDPSGSRTLRDSGDSRDSLVFTSTTTTSTTTTSTTPATAGRMARGGSFSRVTAGIASALFGSRRTAASAPSATVVIVNETPVQPVVIVNRTDPVPIVVDVGSSTSHRIVTSAQSSHATTHSSNSAANRTAKASGSNNRKDADAGADDESEEAKKKKQKEKENSSAVAVLAGVAAVVGLSALAFYSFFKASEHQGRQEFMTSLHNCIQRCEHRLDATRFWIREREILQLAVPDVVRQDVDRLDKLIDALHRLDTRETARQYIPAYLGVGVSTSLLIAGLFGGAAPQHAFALSRIGYAGLLISGSYYAMVWGRHGSELHQTAFVMIATDAKSILDGFSNREEHAKRVRAQLASI